MRVSQHSCWSRAISEHTRLRPNLAETLARAGLRRRAAFLGLSRIGVWHQWSRGILSDEVPTVGSRALALVSRDLATLIDRCQLSETVETTRDRGIRVERTKTKNVFAGQPGRDDRAHARRRPRVRLLYPHIEESVEIPLRFR